MTKVILVQKNSLGRVKYIILLLEGDTVSREWALIGSEKIQKTSNTYSYINKGKANELSPAESAKEDFERIITNKTKEGYAIAESLDKLPDLDSNKMDFNDIPVEFCCSKPYTSISEFKLNKMIGNEKARFFIKENGVCTYILITEDQDVKIYSRRIDEHTKKYPKIVEAVKSIRYLPNTLLITEFVIDPSLKIPHMEGFKLMSSISRSDTLKGKVKENIDQTIALQEIHEVKAVVFNVLFYNGKDLTDLPYSEVYDLHIEHLKNSKQSTLIIPEELEFPDYESANKWAKKNKLQHEGLVVWDREENAEITYNGKPSRRACYKLKPVTEDDVIAYDWKEGSGTKQGKVGSVYIGKYNHTGDEIIPLGRVGSGFKIKEGHCELDYWDFPCVIEIIYDQRFPTGKYQFPRYSKTHLEKIPSDIVIDKDGM